MRPTTTAIDTSSSVARRDTCERCSATGCGGAGGTSGSLAGPSPVSPLTSSSANDWLDGSTVISSGGGSGSMRHSSYLISSLSAGSLSSSPSTWATMTVMLSGPPAALAISMSSRDASSGSAMEPTISPISSSVTTPTRPSEQSMKRSPFRTDTFDNCTSTSSCTPSACRMTLECSKNLACSGVMWPLSRSWFTSDWSRVTWVNLPWRQT
jgi:hypothetical protein